jgi:predicted DNA-binding transcriptional regulator AlpA
MRGAVLECGNHLVARHHKMDTRILRVSEAAEYVGVSKRVLYERVARKTWPKPIHFGPRSAGYFLDELHRLTRAAAAGLDEAEVRRLVERIEAEREHAMGTS